MKRAFGVASVVVALFFASSQSPAHGADESVAVTPPNPTACDALTFTVSGVVNVPGPTGMSINVGGSSIYIDVSLPTFDHPVITIVTPYTLTGSAGPLSAGAYTIYRRYSWPDRTPPQSTSYQFMGTLIVSPCSPQVTVPNVVGMTQSQAQWALAAVGLSVGRIVWTAGSAPAGQVLSQSPLPGRQVDHGSAVELTLSQGSAASSGSGAGASSDGLLYTVGKSGIHQIALDGTVEHVLALHTDSYDIEIRDNRLYVTETTRGGNLIAYSLAGDYITSIPTPAAAGQHYKFVALPNRRFALLDNYNDKAFFIDETGRLLATTKILSAPDGLYQKLAGLVVGNRLILSEGGRRQVWAIDLTTYQASLFKNLSHLPTPLGDLTYADGKYYILAGERGVYRFTESGSAVKVAETGGVYTTGICSLGNFAYISTDSAHKVFRLNLATGSVNLLASGINYPRDIECVESAEGETRNCCGFQPGDRVVLMVDRPLDSQGLPAVGLYAGALGTVVCCDYDDFHRPLFVSWDGWTNGKNSTTYCDSPVVSYTPYSGWWMSCDQIDSWSGGGGGACEADLVPYGNAVWAVTPQTLDLCTSSGMIHFTYGVKNQGCAASGSHSVCFYASTDPTITSSDYLLGSIPKNALAPGESGTWTTGSFPLAPGQLPSGTYFVGFIVDGYNQVQESLESNNVGLISGTLTVASCGGSGGNGGGDSAPVICIGGACFPLLPGPSPSGSGYRYTGSVQIEVELNFRARLTASVTPIPAIGGTWSAWVDPDVIGPGTVTTTIWVQAENLNLGAFPGGLTGVQVATVTIYYVPAF